MVSDSDLHRTLLGVPSRSSLGIPVTPFRAAVPLLLGVEAFGVESSSTM